MPERKALDGCAGWLTASIFFPREGGENALIATLAPKVYDLKTPFSAEKTGIAGVAQLVER